MIYGDYEYFVAVLLPSKGKTRIVALENKRARADAAQDESESVPTARIGIIKWYGAWRRYCFFPSFGTVWSDGCLVSVQGLLDRLNKEHDDARRRTAAAKRMAK